MTVLKGSVYFSSTGSDVMALTTCNTNLGTFLF